MIKFLFYTSYTKMKKSLLLLGLLTTAVCLSACGSKNFNMTFEEALEAANYSALQEILTENDNFEQNFEIAGNFNSDWNKVDAKISSDSKQSLNQKFSESSTNFTANITSSWETTKINWALDIKLVNDTLYINIPSLDLTWDEDLTMIATMTEWIKGQRFFVSMSGLSDMPSTFSILKDSKKLNNKTKEIIKEEGSMVYNWKFSQFNWYNAWKFSIDNEKLNALIKEYYDTINSGADDESIQEIPVINIQSFEWYFVITWKDKVTTVIENMDIQDSNETINVNWFAWENFELTFSKNWQSLIKITADKKSTKYNISAVLWDSILLDGSISPKLSKSSIDLKFDAKLTIKSVEEWKSDTVIPFKGSWKYVSIPEFTVSAPNDAQDLSELLWAYLWWMMWWYDYMDEDIYGDYDIYEEGDLNLHNSEANVESNVESNNEEVWEIKSLENTDNTTTAE